MQRTFPWFRFYSEALDDPKVQRLSPPLFKTWVNLLCLASQSNGDLPSIDDIAFKLRLSANDAEQQVSDLILAGLVDVSCNGMKHAMHGWMKRQFMSDSSTERVRKHRKKKQKIECNADETLHGTPPDTDTEQKQTQSRAESRGAKIDLRLLAKRVTDACGRALASEAIAPGLASMATPQMWLEQGADLERDVLPTLTAAGKRYAGRNIRSWDYFTPMVSEAKAKRERGLPAAIVSDTGLPFKLSPTTVRYAQPVLD